MLDRQTYPYMIYALRLWCDEPATSWRALLESVSTGEQHPFATLRDLCTFLESVAQDPLPLEPKGSEIVL